MRLNESLFVGLPELALIGLGFLGLLPHHGQAWDSYLESESPHKGRADLGGCIGEIPAELPASPQNEKE